MGLFRTGDIRSALGLQASKRFGDLGAGNRTVAVVSKWSSECGASAGGDCMNRELLDQVVDATLYEGYILYPYRASSKKNKRERFTFGRVYPEVYSAAQKGAEPCLIQTECLVKTMGLAPTL